MTRRMRTGELPEAVSRLYGVDKATPVRPLFVFVVGSPGAGKSQVHDALFDLGIFRAGDNYATINLDLLLESLVAFRTGSAFGHALKATLKDAYPADAKKVSSLKSYKSKASNVGAFDFIQDAASRSALLKAVSRKVSEKRGIDAAEAERAVSNIFTRFADLATEFSSSDSVAESLIDLNAEAIEAAIQKHVNVVYETTFSTIDKFHSYYEKLLANGYMIVVLHVIDSVDNISKKLQSRQEYESPFGAYPFYRFVPTHKGLINDLILKNTAVVNLIRERIHSGVYDGDFVFVDEYTSSFDPTRRKEESEFNFLDQSERILGAYGVARRGHHTRRRRRSERRSERKRR